MRSACALTLLACIGLFAETIVTTKSRRRLVQPALAHHSHMDLLADVSLAYDASMFVTEDMKPPDVGNIETRTASEAGCTDAQQVACEAVGTFLLGLASACAGAQNTPLAPFAVVCVLIGLIYSFNKLSGAVFNPAVSIALFMRGRMSFEKAVHFALAQLIASFAAGLTSYAIYGIATAPALSANALNDGFTGLLRAGLAEVLFTGVIVSAVCHASTHHIQKDNDVTGLAIGLTIFGCIVCSDYSGACFNPALGVGMQLSKALLGGGFPVAQAVLYVVAPSIGAVLSSLVFRLITCPNEP